MKKFTNFLLVLLLICSLTFVGCKPKIANVDTIEDKVVIFINDDIDDVNLLTFMNLLKDDELLTFDYQDSTYGAYITAINGVYAGASEWWALYSDDQDVTSDAYQIEYDGKIFYQTILGCESLIVKQNKTYIWVLMGY